MGKGKGDRGDKGGGDAVPRPPRLITKMDIAAMALVVLALMVGTYERNRVWLTEVGLWRDCLKKSPHKDRPYSNVASELLHQGKWKEAEQYIDKGLAINDDPKSTYWEKTSRLELQINKAIILGEQGRYEEAFMLWQLALRSPPQRSWSDGKTNPFVAQINNNIGMYKMKEGKFDEAILYIKEALRIDPNLEIAKNNFKNAVTLKILTEQRPKR